MTPQRRSNTDTLGQYLQAARQAQSLSLRQLEVLSGIPRNTLLRLEQDEVEQPAAATLGKLARVLELNTTDLFLIAGLPVPTEAASLDIMLRTAYNLPPEAVERAKRDIAKLVEKYNGQSDEEANN